MGKSFKLKPRAAIVILLLFFAAGALWQNIMQRGEDKSHAPEGVFVDTGTYSAHCYIKGAGSTTLVFLSGSGTPCAYTDFYYLQNALSEHGQTLSFDHAGFGWSSDTKAKRDIDSLADELAVIIDALVPKDNTILLVSHSLGSLEAIGYTQKYEDRITGIVFLDGGSPEFYAESSEIPSFILNRASAFLRVTGINRLLGEGGVLLPLYGEDIRNKKLPASLKALDKAMYYRHTGSGINLSTISCINENAAAVLNNGSIDTTPVLVLSSDSGEAWQKVQEQLAGWSKSSRQITLDKGEHYIHWSDSDEVIRQIEFFKDTLLK